MYGLWLCPFNWQLNVQTLLNRLFKISQELTTSLQRKLLVLYMRRSMSTEKVKNISLSNLLQRHNDLSDLNIKNRVHVSKWCQRNRSRPVRYYSKYDTSVNFCYFKIIFKISPLWQTLHAGVNFTYLCPQVSWRWRSSSVEPGSILTSWICSSRWWIFPPSLKSLSVVSRRKP